MTFISSGDIKSLQESVNIGQQGLECDALGDSYRLKFRFGALSSKILQAQHGYIISLLGAVGKAVHALPDMLDNVQGL